MSWQRRIVGFVNWRPLTREEQVTLPLRKDSLVAKAMDDAGSTARGSLTSAVKKYFENVKDAADWIHDREVKDAATWKFDEHRAKLLKLVENLDKTVADQKQLLDVALAEYDLNVNEIQLWVNATKGAERIANAAR